MMLFVGGDGSGCTRLIHYLKKSGGGGAIFYFTDPTSPSMFKWFKIPSWLFGSHDSHYKHLKVKNMQRSGTEEIRTQIQLSQQKREITNIKK